jgi:hypothetical protein
MTKPRGKKAAPARKTRIELTADDEFLGLLDRWRERQEAKGKLAKVTDRRRAISFILVGFLRADERRAKRRGE